MGAKLIFIKYKIKKKGTKKSVDLVYWPNRLFSILKITNRTDHNGLVEIIGPTITGRLTIDYWPASMGQKWIYCRAKPTHA